MPVPLPRSPRAVAVPVFGLGLVAALVLSGCTSQAPAPTSTTTSATPTGASTPTPVPSYDASASTPEALTEFDAVVRKLLVTDPQPHGRDVIDALVAAGFDKKAMQVTPDDTTIGRGVDSIQFSVVWKGADCLVGQVGSSGFYSSSAPVLGTGHCLIGTTRTIDW